MKKIICLIISSLMFTAPALAESEILPSRVKSFDNVFSESIGTDIDNIKYGIICFPSEGINRVAELDEKDIQSLKDAYSQVNGECIIAPVNSDFDSRPDIDENYPYFYIGISAELPAERQTWYRNVKMTQLCFGGEYGGAAIYGGYGKGISTYGEDSPFPVMPRNFIWYKPCGSDAYKVAELGSELYNKYKDKAKVLGDYEGTHDEQYFSGYDGTWETKNSMTCFFTADGCSEWAYDILQKAAGNNLIPYNTSTQYTSPVTRREFCVLTANMLNMIPYRNYNDLFENPDGYTVISEKVHSVGVDLKNIQYSDMDTVDESIRLLSELGIINGMGDGTFNPDGYITREQICTIFSRAFDVYKEFDKYFSDLESLKEISELTVYNDDNMISDWARDGVYTMTKYNFMSGVGNNYFEPQEYCTLEQAITIISKIGNICSIGRL